MEAVGSLFTIVSQFLRVAVAAIVVVLALVCVVDWLVRTRRVSAFSPLARFLRQTVSPLLRPIERSVVRAGGLPSAAPLWALAAAIVGGIVLITAVDYLFGQILLAVYSARSGSRGIALLLIRWTFAILQIALILRVISSWFRISPYARWIRWAYALSEPILRPLRSFMPTLGPIDITPVIAFFILSILQRFLIGFLF